MFSFCEVFAGRAMVTDAGTANNCRRKIKAPWLQTKVQKMKDLPKISFTEKRFEDFSRKKYISRLHQITIFFILVVYFIIHSVFFLDAVVRCG